MAHIETILFLMLWIASTPLTVFWWCFECGMLEISPINDGLGVIFAAMFIILGFMVGMIIGPFGALLFGVPMLCAKFIR